DWRTGPAGAAACSAAASSGAAPRPPPLGGPLGEGAAERRATGSALGHAGARACSAAFSGAAPGPPPDEQPPGAAASGELAEAKRRRLGVPAEGALFHGAMCAICQEVIHRAASAQPCMHTFCSSCLGTCLQSKLSCPVFVGEEHLCIPGLAGWAPEP
ncbi:unnamed protein product, partial [Prorocentrum cordatum]